MPKKRKYLLIALACVVFLACMACFIVPRVLRDTGSSHSASVEEIRITTRTATPVKADGTTPVDFGDVEVIQILYGYQENGQWHDEPSEYFDLVGFSGELKGYDAATENHVVQIGSCVLICIVDESEDSSLTAYDTLGSEMLFPLSSYHEKYNLSPDLEYNLGVYRENRQAIENGDVSTWDVTIPFQNRGYIIVPLDDITADYVLTYQYNFSAGGSHERTITGEQILALLDGQTLGASDEPKETQSQDAEPVVYHTQQGKLTPETQSDTATVWANPVTAGEIQTDVYLEVETGGTVLTYELGHWDHFALHEGTLSLADLDGDGTDEIVLIMVVTGNGGTLAQVYGVRDNGIVMLWDLNDIPLGITTQYRDGYIMVLENTSAGFSQEVKISEEYWPDEFDENGKFTGSVEAYVSPVSEGFVIPATEEELPGISCTREISYTDFSGYLTAVLRYNPATGTLEPVEMAFEPETVD